MQFPLAMATVWPTTLLLLWFFSLAYAATPRPDLKAKSGGLAIAELHEPEVMTDGYYTMLGDSGFDEFLACKKATPVYKFFNEGTSKFVACCAADDHLSGSLATGLSCCGAGTERSGSGSTGYACCPPGKQVKGSVAGGKYLCCDSGQEFSGDENTGYACCPPGTKVSGTVADGKYLCCKAGTQRTGSEPTGYFCCGTGEEVVGSDPTGYACCPVGQTISGNVKGGQYLCCGAGHERTGSPATGYTCCPEGSVYEDKICKPAKALCANGKQMVDNKCVCPTGTTEDKTGNCVVPPPPPPPTVQCPPGTIADASGQCVTKPCDSGIVTGKCYEIANRDDRLWGYFSNINCYSAAAAGDESAHFKIGKFQFCMDSSCTKGVNINPTSGFSMKDIHGIPPAGNKPNSWLNNAKGGNHIAKTWDYAEAGRFSITKWPCGKYCIGGASPNGLSATCPAQQVGITFAAGDPQACIEVKLKEVPCDIRDMANNCIWKSPADPCCGSPVDCSTVASLPAVAPAGNAPAAQKPVKGK